MAATFGQEAKGRLDAVAGATRAEIERLRGKSGAWAAKLVRGAESYRGLHSLSDVIEMASRDRHFFAALKDARNRFGHEVPKTFPAISAEEARDILVVALSRIR